VRLRERQLAREPPPVRDLVGDRRDRAKHVAAIDRPLQDRVIERVPTDRRVAVAVAHASPPLSPTRARRPQVGSIALSVTRR